MSVKKTKICKGCGKEYPREEFPFKSKIEGLRWAYGPCCIAEMQARKNAQHSIAAKNKRRRLRSGVPVDCEPALRLNGARVAIWLYEQEHRLYAEHFGTQTMIRNEREDRRNRRLKRKRRLTENNGRQLLADWLGTSERQISRLLDGQRKQYRHYNSQVTILIDTFDRWLCHAGIPHVLRELFPELYDFPEQPELNLDTPLTTWILEDDPEYTRELVA